MGRATDPLLFEQLTRQDHSSVSACQCVGGVLGVKSRITVYLPVYDYCCSYIRLSPTLKSTLVPHPGNLYIFVTAMGVSDEGVEKI